MEFYSETHNIYVMKNSKSSKSKFNADLLNMQSNLFSKLSALDEQGENCKQVDELGFEMVGHSNAPDSLTELMTKAKHLVRKV